MSTNIGWVGTGVMGAPMAGHLQAAGHKLFVYNRTAAKAQVLVDAGAVLCESPREVARQSEFVFSIVGYPVDVESTYLSTDGILAGAKAGSVVIDMTTSEPALAKRICKVAGRQGVDVLDAPVSGGDIGARNAALAIMVGGEQSVFDRVKPLFQCMGKNIAYMGPTGAGQHTKMSNQILIAGTMIGTVESLMYEHRSGLNLEEVIDVIGSGAGVLGPSIILDQEL